MIVSYLRRSLNLDACLYSSWAAAAGAAAQVGGSILGSNAQSKANDQNVGLSKEQMEWQALMSNTAHQREVRDLRLAGLNPILSATGGSGASTPSGSVGKVEAVDIGSSAKAAADAYAQFSAMSAQNQNTMADTALKAQQTQLSRTQEASTAKQVEAQSIDNSVRAQKLAGEMRNTNADAASKEQANQLARSTFKSTVDRAQSESTKSSNSAKYDHLGYKYLENSNLMPSSAKASDSVPSKIFSDIKNMFGAGYRKILSK
jgi:hypothetical protein